MRPCHNQALWRLSFMAQPLFTFHAPCFERAPVVPKNPDSQKLNMYPWIYIRCFHPRLIHVLKGLISI